MKIFSDMKAKFAGLRDALTNSLKSLNIAFDEKADPVALVGLLSAAVTTARTELATALKNAGTAPADSTAVTELKSQVETLTKKLADTEEELGNLEASIDEKATTMAMEQMAKAGFKPVAVSQPKAPGQASANAWEQYKELSDKNPAAASEFYNKNKAAIIAAGKAPIK